ncbi:MAG: hypothetical protein PHD95_04800 [Candidatus ainarchaeum sp.]|nr:hypothetical protein [Candidatus ainarchaeum sp.]
MQKKPMRRPELKRRVASLRRAASERAFAEFILKFPNPEVAQRHYDRIRQALAAKTVDWEKVKNSINYWDRVRTETLELNKKFGKAIRSGLRLGMQPPSIMAEQLQSIQEMQQQAFSDLARIKARRKMELGK